MASILSRIRARSQETVSSGRARVQRLIAQVRCHAAGELPRRPEISVCFCGCQVQKLEAGQEDSQLSVGLKVEKAFRQELSVGRP